MSNGMLNIHNVGNAGFVFKRAAGGRVTGMAARKQGPDVPCQMVMLTAHPDNTGIVYVGGSNVTAFEGLPLEAGASLGPLPVDNLSVFYFISTVAGDALHYLILK